MTEPTSSKHDPEVTANRVGLVVRWLAGLGLLALAVGFAAHLLRSEVEQLGRMFVDRAGYAGMAFGTMLADGFQFPVPPQFYMLLAIASEGSDGWALFSITVGSLLGGVAGYVCSRRLSRLDWFQRKVQSLTAKHAVRNTIGPKGMLVLGLSPIAYSWLIYFCGINQYRWRFFGLLAALRIPKLMVYYWLVRLGWDF